MISILFYIFSMALGLILFLFSAGWILCGVLFLGMTIRTCLEKNRKRQKPAGSDFAVLFGIAAVSIVSIGLGLLFGNFAVWLIF